MLWVHVPVYTTYSICRQETAKCNVATMLMMKQCIAIAIRSGKTTLYSGDMLGASEVTAWGAPTLLDMVGPPNKRPSLVYTFFDLPVKTFCRPLTWILPWNSGLGDQVLFSKPPKYEMLVIVNDDRIPLPQLSQKNSIPFFYVLERNNSPEHERISGGYDSFLVKIYKALYGLIPFLFSLWWTLINVQHPNVFFKCLFSVVSSLQMKTRSLFFKRKGCDAYVPSIYYHHPSILYCSFSRCLFIFVLAV